MNYKESKLNSKKGFSLIELLVVITISGILFGVVGFNLVRLQNTTTRRTLANTLVSDLKLQQVKAMNGSTEGRTTSDDYGVYFLSDQYILFHGAIYDSDETSNFSIPLPENVEITGTTFLDNTVVFENLSGVVMGFSSGNNTITLRELNTNTQQTITINRYGVITSLN